MDPETRIKLEVLSKIIDELDYYQILKVRPDASTTEIKGAYHAESREFHPDNFADEPDQGTREMVLKVAKAVNEAYSVLKDFDRRRKYDAILARPPGERRIRYVEEEQEAQKKQPEDGFQTDQGRRLFNQGVLEAKMKRWVQAEKTLRIALSFEPGNQQIEKLLEEVGRHHKSHLFAIKL
jgi:DnaJ-class molecular chaperone